MLKSLPHALDVVFMRRRADKGDSSSSSSSSSSSIRDGIVDGSDRGPMTGRIFGYLWFATYSKAETSRKNEYFFNDGADSSGLVAKSPKNLPNFVFKIS